MLRLLHHFFVDSFLYPRLRLTERVLDQTKFNESFRSTAHILGLSGGEGVEEDF